MYKDTPIIIASNQHCASNFIKINHDYNKHIEHLSEYWEGGEHLWLGHIPRDQLVSDGTFDDAMNNIINFIGTKSYNVDPGDNFDWLGYKNSNTIEVTKMTVLGMLSKEFIENGDFHTPLSAHWNPRLNRNVCHPGSSRLKPIAMFGNSNIDVIYFNTGAFRVDWMEHLVPVVIKDILSDGWHINLVPDHGSLIPHCFKNTEYDFAILNDVFKSIANKFLSDDFKLYFNHNNTMDLAVVNLLQLLSDWVTDDPELSSVKITFKEISISKAACSTAVMSALLDHNFENNIVKIE